MWVLPLFRSMHIYIYIYIYSVALLVQGSCSIGFTTYRTLVAMNAESYERIVAVAVGIAASPAGRDKNKSQPIYKRLKVRFYTYITVDELVDGLWPLRQWIVQYTVRSDDITFLANMKAMILAMVDKEYSTTAGCGRQWQQQVLNKVRNEGVLNEVLNNSKLWQATKISMVDSDQTAGDTFLPAILGPTRPQQVWKLTRKHFSRLVSRV